MVSWLIASCSALNRRGGGGRGREWRAGGRAGERTRRAARGARAQPPRHPPPQKKHTHAAATPRRPTHPTRSRLRPRKALVQAATWQNHCSTDPRCQRRGCCLHGEGGGGAGGGGEGRGGAGGGGRGGGACRRSSTPLGKACSRGATGSSGSSPSPSNGWQTGCQAGKQQQAALARPAVLCAHASPLTCHCDQQVWILAVSHRHSDVVGCHLSLCA